MKNIELKYNQVIVGSDIRSLILGYATKAPTFLVNYKQSKVCDFYHMPFFVSNYKTKYSVIFKQHNSNDLILYPKPSIETDLSCLLGMDGLIYPEFSSMKVVDENKIMFFGRKNIYSVTFEKCIIIDPLFDISFLETQKTNEHIYYEVFDLFYFPKKLENYYKNYGNMQTWRMSDSYKSLTDSIAIFVKKFNSLKEIEEYNIDMVKRSARMTLEVINKEFFQLNRPSEYIFYNRFIEKHGRESVYIDTDTIKFIYDTDLQIIEKINGK